MNEKKEIRFIELFAGVGGFRLGLENVSERFKAVFANEIDKYACQVYRKRFGDKESRAVEPISGRSGIQSGRIVSDNSSTGGKQQQGEYSNYGEWDEASKLLEGDIRKVPSTAIPDHDLICAGFPCQSFSIAGKREGFKDLTRGTLFFEILRIAGDKRPKYLLLENVKGLLSSDSGRTFAIILLSLDELGYDAEWFVANTKYYLPQNRERVFIFCTRRGG